jgi:hypothetical protein
MTPDEKAQEILDKLDRARPPHAVAEELARQALRRLDNLEKMVVAMLWLGGGALLALFLRVFFGVGA